MCGKPESELSPATASLNLGCLPRLFAWATVAALGMILWTNRALLGNLTGRVLKRVLGLSLGTRSADIPFVLLCLFDRLIFWVVFWALVLHLLPGTVGARLRSLAGHIVRDLWRAGMRTLHIFLRVFVRFGRWVNGGGSPADKSKKSKTKDAT